VSEDEAADSVQYTSDAQGFRKTLEVRAQELRDVMDARVYNQAGMTESLIHRKG
jgi:hypothetical protein